MGHILIPLQWQDRCLGLHIYGFWNHCCVFLPTHVPGCRIQEGLVPILPGWVLAGGGQGRRLGEPSSVRGLKRKLRKTQERRERLGQKVKRQAGDRAPYFRLIILMVCCQSEQQELLPFPLLQPGSSGCLNLHGLCHYCFFPGPLLPWSLQTES